jgi:hypothetical protein
MPRYTRALCGEVICGGEPKVTRPIIPGWASGKRVVQSISKNDAGMCPSKFAESDGGSLAFGIADLALRRLDV